MQRDLEISRDSESGYGGGVIGATKERRERRERERVREREREREREKSK